MGYKPERILEAIKAEVASMSSHYHTSSGLYDLIRIIGRAGKEAFPEGTHREYGLVIAEALGRVGVGFEGIFDRKDTSEGLRVLELTRDDIPMMQKAHQDELKRRLAA